MVWGKGCCRPHRSGAASAIRDPGIFLGPAASGMKAVAGIFGSTHEAAWSLNFSFKNLTNYIKKPAWSAILISPRWLTLLTYQKIMPGD
jgi:hypothetical protein